VGNASGEYVKVLALTVDRHHRRTRDGQALEERPVGAEYLHPVVHVVGHIDPALVVHRHRDGKLEALVVVAEHVNLVRPGEKLRRLVARHVDLHHAVVGLPVHRAMVIAVADVVAGQIEGLAVGAEGPAMRRDGNLLAERKIPSANGTQADRRAFDVQPAR